jgi:hypothetical protein
MPSACGRLGQWPSNAALARRHRADAKYSLKDNGIQQSRGKHLPVHRSTVRFAAGALFALAVGGCSGGMFDKNEGGLFAKPADIFAKPDWARPAATANDMLVSGPVGPDDLVDPDGRCAAPATGAPVATAPAPPTATPAAAGDAGGMAGELSSQPAPATPPALTSADANAPPVLGGVALGMTECQVVRRGGQPGNVAISAGEKGQRQVALTYLGGAWPGIYHFADGRLKEIDAAPVPPAPAKPPAKKSAKKKPAAAKTSQTEIRTVQ